MKHLTIIISSLQASEQGFRESILLVLLNVPSHLLHKIGKPIIRITLTSHSIKGNQTPQPQICHRQQPLREPKLPKGEYYKNHDHAGALLTSLHPNELRKSTCRASVVGVVVAFICVRHLDSFGIDGGMYIS